MRSERIAIRQVSNLCKGVDLRHAAKNSLAGFTKLHFVERSPLDLALKTIQELFRVLEPGGVSIAETPNLLNLLVGASTSRINPTVQ